MTLHRILAATDFSAHSRAALSRAAAVARARHAQLIVAHVFDKGRYVSSVGRALDAERLTDEKNGLRLLLEGTCSDLGADLAISSMFLEGLPDEQIVEAAQAMSVDLVFVGSHGRTGLERLLTGSVAENVVRMSLIPTVLGRGPAEAGFHRILVATDFSDFADRALAAAVELAEPPARIELLHVVHVPAGFGGEPMILVEDSTFAALEADARQRGAERLARIAGPGLELHFDCVVGAPREAILRAVGKNHDLVALGSHGRRGLRRLLLGSVAETVMRHAPCSVLVA
jgi:nucleotide-binding universal stress UspA family protein